jgi:hypothetical protein
MRAAHLATATAAARTGRRHRSSGKATAKAAKPALAEATERSQRRKIRLIESNAKCRYLKKSSFVGPKRHSPIGSMPFHRAQKTLHFQGPTPSYLPT